jgi:hypothetical protein
VEGLAMMSAVVDRVARAIAHANCEDDFDRVSEEVQTLYREEARAAIRAMRDPSDAMLIAGNSAGLATASLLDDSRFACERATYIAMVDAALIDPTTGKPWRGR